VKNETAKPFEENGHDDESFGASHSYSSSSTGIISYYTGEMMLLMWNILWMR